MNTLNENEEPSGLGQGRERQVNYINICHNLVDTYPYGLAHGLQKDAIQNSLDARASKKNPAVIKFEVIKTAKGRFLTITDTNTKGLRGAAQNANAEDEESDWLRFESFAVTKIDPNAIGARGQGKFVMLCSSSEYKMFYDTKRADGVYRLGGTQALEKGSPIWPETGVWEDETATSELAKHCGLKPLQEDGTRLIIFEPKEEILEAIKNGELKQAIQETWFRAIEKKQLEVYIIVDGQHERVDVPDIIIDTKTPKAESWLLDKDFKRKVITASIKDGKYYSQTDYRIKKFEAYYDPDRELDEAWQGIAIIHNGMKICIPEGTPLTAGTKEKVTGFIEFEKELDQELRKGNNQNPNHYDLKWRSAIPKEIRAYINKQLYDFGKEKLGLFQEQKEKKKRVQTEAEDWAMDMLQKHAPDLNLFGARGRGNSNSSTIDIPPPPDKNIGIAFKGFTFPNDSRKPRVNFDEKISFNLSVFNKTSNTINGKISLRVFKGDRRIYNFIDESKEAIQISPNNIDCRIQNEPLTLAIDENQFSEKGQYRILARLFDENGSELDKSSKPFWVESDPPQNNAPFEQRHSPLPEPFLAWKTHGGIGNDPILYFNTKHPEYQEAENNNEDYREYIFKLCLEGAIHFILSLSTDSDADDLYAPLDTSIIGSGDPARIHEEVMKYIAQIRWKIHQEEVE